MRDEYVFDIPIYLCTKEKYDADMEAAVEKHLRFCYEEQGLVRPTNDTQTLEIQASHVREPFGGPWDFNQIIAWLRLFLEGYAIGGHYWRTDSKRLARNTRKRFILGSYSNCLAFHVDYPSTSAKIYAAILETLHGFADDKSMRKRYMDLSVFERTGPFIDWHNLFEAHLQRQREYAARVQPEQ